MQSAHGAEHSVPKPGQRSLWLTFPACASHGSALVSKGQLQYCALLCCQLTCRFWCALRAVLPHGSKASCQAEMQGQVIVCALAAAPSPSQQCYHVGNISSELAASKASLCCVGSQPISWQARKLDRCHSFPFRVLGTLCGPVIHCPQCLSL